MDTIDAGMMPLAPIEYPDSDGKPMADNTKQFEAIVALQGNLDELLPDVFVAGDLLWYPVEGQPKIRCAPDVLIAFGRPKGHRGSYRQWQEGDVAPHVVFGVLSPGNTLSEMTEKRGFYDKYGVEEYYVFDPDEDDWTGYLRKGKSLKAIASLDGWVSPRLGMRAGLRDRNMPLRPRLVSWPAAGHSIAIILRVPVLERQLLLARHLSARSPRPPMWRRV